MGYEGEILRMCTSSFDFTDCSVIVVNGDQFNPCGHALLNVADADGTAGGWYFQVAGLYDYPRYMDAWGYQRYLNENDKTELYRLSLSIPDPDGAIQTLEQLMGKKWVWGGIVHNCGTFVETVAEGGGGTAYPLINCPLMVPTARSIKPVLPPYRMGP